MTHAKRHSGTKIQPINTIKALSLFAAAITLVGCGGQQDLSDRPYIMACYGTSFLHSEDPHPHVTRHNPQLPTQLAGITLPNFKEILSSLPINQRAIDREIGFTREQTSLNTSTATLPLTTSTHYHEYRNTGKFTHRPSGIGDSIRLHDPVGTMTVEHLFMTEDGKLHSVDDFHIAAVDFSHSSAYRLMNWHVAAAIPADATYAVYRIRAETSQYRAPLHGDRPAMKGQPGYWVMPLNDSHRYRPYQDNDEHGPFEQRRLGPYVGTTGLAYADEGTRARGGIGNHIYYTHTLHRRADRDVETVPCLMNLGSPYEIDDWFDVEAGPNSDGYYPPLSGPGIPNHQTGNRAGLYFVGDRESLRNLPSDPSRFEG